MVFQKLMGVLQLSSLYGWIKYVALFCLFDCSNTRDTHRQLQSVHNPECHHNHLNNSQHRGRAPVHSHLLSLTACIPLRLQTGNPHHPEVKRHSPQLQQTDINQARRLANIRHPARQVDINLPHLLANLSLHLQAVLANLDRHRSLEWESCRCRDSAWSQRVSCRLGDWITR